MTPSPPNEPSSPPAAARDELELRDVAAALLRYRLLIAVFTLAGLGAGVAASLLSTRHVAQGLFLTPRLSLGDYKQYEVSLANGPRLRDFLQSSGTDAATAEVLTRHVLVPEQLARSVRPVFSVTGRDAKNYDIRTDEAGELVGVQLRIALRDPGTQTALDTLAEYLRGTALQIDLREYILGQCFVHRTREQELRNQQLDRQFAIEQQRQRAAALRRLIADVPAAARDEGRQVVSLADGGQRFLPASTQLVAAEVAIADLELEIAQRQRERSSALLKKGYYCGARDLLDRPATAQQFLDGLVELQQRVFEGRSAEDEVVELTSNALEIERDSWVSKYLERMRFVVNPTGDRRIERMPSPAAGVALGGTLGLLLGILAALLVDWWRRNRDALLARDA